MQTVTTQTVNILYAEELQKIVDLIFEPCFGYNIRQSEGWERGSSHFFRNIRARELWVEEDKAINQFRFAKTGCENPPIKVILTELVNLLEIPGGNYLILC